MKNKKGNVAVIALIIIVVAIVAGAGGWFAKKSQAPVQKEVVTQLAPVAQTQPAVQSASSNKSPISEWESYSNYANLSFKYPAKWCYSDTDCRKLHIIVAGDESVTIGQEEGNSEITNVFSIYFKTGVSSIEADKFLRNKLNLNDNITWVGDKNNSSVTIAVLNNPRQYALYSSEGGGNVAALNFTDCVFDYCVDGDGIKIMNSIELEGVKLYNNQ